MFAFDIDYKHWSEIHYPRAHLRDTYVPRERAFHTSTVIGKGHFNFYVNTCRYLCIYFDREISLNETFCLSVSIYV